MEQASTYAEALQRMSYQERQAPMVGLYYEDQGWFPCVPILASTRARPVPHVSMPSVVAMRVVEIDPSH